MKAEILNKIDPVTFRAYNYERDKYGLFIDSVDRIWVCGYLGVTCLSSHLSYTTESFKFPVKRLPAGTEIKVTQTE